jgi:PAS domain S-box-containing protein
MTDALATLAPPAADPMAERLRQVEADLQAQTELLRTVLDESPDLIVLKDWEGNFLLANRPVADFYGTTPEAMIGHHDGHFGVPTEMAEQFRQNVRAIMASGHTEIVHEDSRDARTGAISHFRSIKKPFTGPDGQPRILVIAHDITDIRRAQLRAEDSERRLQYALEATGDAVWDWEIPSNRLTVSQRWCDLLGYRPDELGGTLADFLGRLLDEERPGVGHAIQECLTAAAPTTCTSTACAGATAA